MKLRLNLNWSLILLVVASMTLFTSFFNDEKEIVFFWEFGEVLENDIYMDSPTDISSEGEQGIEEWNSDSFENGEEIILEELEGTEDWIAENAENEAKEEESASDETSLTISDEAGLPSEEEKINGDEERWGSEELFDLWIETMDFQIFAAPSDAPGGISTNLMLRTKADDAGCTPGSTCSSWKDNSAYANNVETYGTMTLQAGNPAHNFQPYFTNFSSSNFFDEQTSSVALTTSQYTIIPTVFTVARVTTAGNVNGRMVGIDNELWTTYNSAEPGLWIRNGQQYTYRFSNGINQLANAYTFNTTSLFGWKIATTLDMRLNGKSSTFSVGNPSIWWSHLTIGYGTRNEGGPFPGDLQEVIWYNGALTATEIQKVESYLALKYGVSLDQTSPRDYVASDGTTKMRDATLAGIYSKDIAGIGRDDASALNQKQSTSVNSNLITMGLGTIATSNAVNTSPFLTDKTFLSWANDGGSVANWSGTNTPNNYYSLPRNWQMQLVNNGVGSVQLRATNLPTDMGTVSLLLDDDGNFTNGGTQAFQMTQKGSEYEVNFTPSASVAYFTIATRLPDTTPPVAVLNGNTIMTIIQGTTYIEAGATWTDNYDGTGTINPASSGSVDTSTPGTYTLEYRYTDQAGNQSNMVTRIVEILPKNIIGNLIYTPAGPAWTSWTVATTVTLNISGTVASSGWTAIGNNGIQRQKIYTGNTLLESVFFQNPTYNLTGESFVNITWIDTTPPTCDVAYDVEDPTNGDVVASLTGCSELITVTNNPNTTPNTDYLFTGNDSFTFEFVDHVGNTGSAVATVNNIDRTPPTCSVAYSTTNPTNQAVTVSLTSCSETVTPYPQSYTFTGNKNYTFNFTDHVGNMGQVTATVNYIDKILPKITNLTYIPDTATSGNVEVIITLDEPSIITWRTTANNLTFTKIFDTNTGYTLTFTDLVGNTNTTGITIDRIDKDAPYATNVTYTPSTDTNGSVTATLTVNETVTLPTGRSGNATGTTFTRVYNTNETTSVAFYDLVGNLGSTGISITRIDTVKPGATVTYSPTTATSGTVTATLTTDKTITLPAGRSGNATGTVFTKVYTANENSSFIITDPVGNTGEATVIITRIDKTAPEVIGLTYTPASYTNTDVEVSIETSEPIYLPAGRNGNATGTIFTKIFSANTGIILDIYDLVYNQGSTGITINRIDKTAVTGTITYGPNTDTNTDVTATISFNKIPVTVTNNGGNTNYTFTGDGSFTFEFVDQYGNTGSETATVTRIDKTAPTCTIDYNPSTNTNQDVIATLTGCSETVTPYPQSYTFTGNGSYTFNFADLVGNTWSTTANVNYIDKTIPQITNLTYSPNTATSGNVEVSITLDEPSIITWRATANNLTFTKIFDTNTGYTLTFTDLVGNMDTTGISINRIDKYAPYATNVTYTPSTNTNGSVTATLTVNETVTLPAGRNGNATGTIFTKIFSANTGITLTISDLVGNMDTTGITINWIDKTAVTGSIAYSPNTNTNQDVNATITFNKPNVTVTNNGGSTNYTFTGNDSFTFEFVDQYGNTWSTTAMVNRIDKTIPSIISMVYSPNAQTSGPVIVTITLNKPGTVVGWTKVDDDTYTKTYTSNMSEIVIFFDNLGNVWMTMVSISRIIPTTTPWGWDGGGNALVKDACPNGDFSFSYYDGSCGDALLQEGDEWLGHGSAEEPIEKESEYLTAYEWAYQNGITTMDTYEKARIMDPITREEMAKMISVYATTFLDKKPDLTKSACSQFEDLSVTTVEMQHYMTLSCQLGLMGMNGDGVGVQLRFNPYPWLTRAEAGTVLSRMFRGLQYATQLGDETYYGKHLQALKKAGIMNYISDPSLLELRGNIFIMLMRPQKNS